MKKERERVRERECMTRRDGLLRRVKERLTTDGRLLCCALSLACDATNPVSLPPLGVPAALPMLHHTLFPSTRVFLTIF